MAHKKILAIVTTSVLASASVIGAAAANGKGDALRKGQSRAERVVTAPYEPGSGGLYESESRSCLNVAPVVSCVEFPTSSKDRYVTVAITDATGLPVPAIVDFDSPDLGTETPICGATSAPIKVIPGLKVFVWVNARSVVSPCAGTGTRGVVTATFTKRP